MFKIKDINTDEESDEENKSKYFRTGSTLKTIDGSQSSTSSVATTSASNSQHVIQSDNCPKDSQQSDDKQLNPLSNRRLVSYGNTLVVNPNQTGNKLLKHLKGTYVMSESISPAHYLMYDSICALFLSLKYHMIYNNYISDKLNELGNTYQLKVLLLLVDHIDFRSALKELTKMAIRTNCTLMIAWSYEESANYIENYRHFADKSADIIMGKTNTTSDRSHETAYQCLTEALTSVKSINKTDAISLISTFDTFDNIVKSDEDQLIICPGMAALKAQRLRQFFHKPFIRSDS